MCHELIFDMYQLVFPDVLGWVTRLPIEPSTERRTDGSVYQSPEHDEVGSIQLHKKHDVIAW